jgi:hypothetical protein
MSAPEGSNHLRFQNPDQAEVEREKTSKTLHPTEYTDGESSLNNEVELQTGVKKVEAISSSWTKWSLIVAYVS